MNSVEKPYFPGLTTSLVEPPSGMAVTGKTPYLPQILYSNRSSRYYIVMLQYDFITRQYNFQRPLLCLPLLHLPLPMSLLLPTGFFLTIVHKCYAKCFCLSVFVIQLLSGWTWSRVVAFTSRCKKKSKPQQRTLRRTWCVWVALERN